MRILLSALALCITLTSAAPLAARADGDDGMIYGPHGVPVYDRWQTAWDRFEYDRHHVILGRVAAFAPYRLQVARRDGVVQMIDLKNGTVILPTGATPAPAQFVAVIGYYSRGTFIANRVILRN